MTQTFELTEKETAAAMLLMRDCLNGMGGERPSDLEHDEYTWTSISVLMDAGYNQNEAAGLFSSLMEKGFIEKDRDGSAVSTAGWRWFDTVWDELTAKAKDVQ